jgi:aminoglycoside 6'-N-acetyltransferase
VPDGVQIRGRLTTVRAATEDDAALLSRWHADPEVARYWDDKTFTEADMRVRLGRDDVESYIVEEGETPVGYLQVWSEGDGGGIDMFLVPDARGRGLGPDAARAVALHLRDVRGWAVVTVDPYLWNEGGVRAWRRAGFRDVEEREPDDEHTARWLLMEFAG